MRPGVYEPNSSDQVRGLDEWMLTASRPLMWIPLRYVFTSAMPLPAASGSTNDTRAPATDAYIRLIPTYMKKGAANPPACTADYLESRAP